MRRIRIDLKEFDDLLAGMQTPASRRAAIAAFNATPEQLGAAAVKAAMAEKLVNNPPRPPAVAARKRNQSAKAIRRA